MHKVKVGSIEIGGGNPLVLIAGPCVLEKEKEALEIAQELKRITDRLNIPFIFKSSYDKANRTSVNSYRGPGLKKGLPILKKVKEKFKIPILSDVHCQEDIKDVKDILDIIQVPAFLCRQTDFITRIARTGKAINIKKGQFLAPWDIKNIIEKITRRNNRRILITERGTSFGYNNLVVDMRGLVIMAKFGCPIIFDATHSVQLPGSKGTSSGGDREFVSHLSRAATAVGIDGLFLEVHPDPNRASCDGPNSIALNKLEPILKIIKEIDRIVKKRA
ncbi:MAG: 3-deoxy-8-phosphooctulonate synthase [Candidatus Omnitrophica bacterium]|nr:3-deoxy-8-phosphooctulonate synthase [Candidatus Omnitrophota bacterium]